MAIRTLDIQFPSRGVVRRVGLRQESESRGPYPTPWSTNVRLEDSITNRLRGGSFVAQAPLTKGDPVYRDRAITFEGNAITAARQGNPLDTSISADVSDMQRPIVFQLAEADDIGDDVVAVIPHKDAYLLCFTAGETWVLAGDPATGQRRRVSDQCGIVGPSAWCVAHDTIYFLSSHGLYSVSADGGNFTPISSDSIPEELTGVTDAATVLDYNHADYGVYIHIPTAAVSWFYDSARQGFWPFKRTTTNSHVLLGPFRIGIGQLNHYGKALSIQGNIAVGSADVTWRIVPGRTAEEAARNGKLAIQASLGSTSFSSYVHSTGVWTAGRSHQSYPRTRAMFVCLWLHSVGTWGYEAASIVATLSGRWR